MQSSKVCLNSRTDERQKHCTLSCRTNGRLLHEKEPKAAHVAMVKSVFQVELLSGALHAASFSALNLAPGASNALRKLILCCFRLLWLPFHIRFRSQVMCLDGGQFV